MTTTRHILILCMALFAIGHAAAQDTLSTGRRITPVRPSTNVTLQPGKDVSADIVEKYITGDTLQAIEQARRDSIRRIYTHYPAITEWWFGVNFIEPALMALGRDYASADIHATLNMWNRLQPTVAIGLGWAKSTPDDLNYTYRGKLSPYVKIGANYNFLFKSDPKYQLLFGFRLGWSQFKYDITDISHSNSYWQETDAFDIRDQKTNAFWGELLAAIKVHIAKRFSLGWSVRWHSMFSCKKPDNSRPWFVPGYGTRNGNFGFSFSMFYTLPGKNKTITINNSITNENSTDFPTDTRTDGH